MKQARTYFLLAIGVLSLSCVKTETVTQDETANVPIFFNTEAGTLAESKSIITSTETFNKAGNRLKVYDKHTIGTSSAMYIDGLEYTYGAGGWTSEPTKYWTKEGIHEFSVHNSYITATQAQGTGVSAPEVTYNQQDKSLSISKWTPDHRFDFLYASASRDLSAPNPYAPVHLQMKHLLCAVQFNIEDLIPKIDDHATKIKFNSIKISNFKNTANITIPFKGEPEISFETGLNSITLDGQTQELEFAKPFNIFKGNEYGDEGCLLFLPHNREIFETVSIDLVYTEIRWEAGNYGQWNQKTETKRKSINLSSQGNASNWKTGNKYIYSFLIHDDKISFKVDVVPWVIDDVILDE